MPEVYDLAWGGLRLVPVLKPETATGTPKRGNGHEYIRRTREARGDRKREFGGLSVALGKGMRNEDGDVPLRRPPIKARADYWGRPRTHASRTNVRGKLALVLFGSMTAEAERFLKTG